MPRANHRVVKQKSNSLPLASSLWSELTSAAMGHKGCIFNLGVFPVDNESLFGASKPQVLGSLNLRYPDRREYNTEHLKTPTPVTFVISLEGQEKTRPGVQVLLFPPY